jgi:ectoine hydroxylase-related dioxygenase (phytanoyl-CoA dioxygenase family)
MALLSGITALEDNTLLLVMRDSLESYEGQLEAVALNAGDVLIFHALLVHAGGNYSRTNRRIHFTALSQNGMSRPINETYVV